MFYKAGSYHCSRTLNKSFKTHQMPRGVLKLLFGFWYQGTFVSQQCQINLVTMKKKKSSMISMYSTAQN